MDGLTQGLLGAVAGQSLLGRQLGGRAAVIGFAAGATPDLDILIRSGADPLLAFEYHRHFTHSLVFIPLGGLLVGLTVWLFYRRSQNFWQVWLCATAGWATHGILDVLTSYGTNLLWPFSDRRLAWDWIGIIDLFISLPLLIGMLLAVRRKSPWPARIGLGLALVTIGFGALQHHRAQGVQERIAAARGHALERGRVLPSPLSLSLWRSVYQHQGRLYADAVWVAPCESAGYWPGGNRALARPADLADLLPGGQPGSDLMRDLLRFEHFADGYLARLEDDPGVRLGDFRYALAPGSTQPMWGIRFDPTRPELGIERFRAPRNSWAILWRYGEFLRGLAPGRQPVPGAE